MDVKISGLACVPRGKLSKQTAATTPDTSGLLQAPVQQCFFVLGQINTGTQTMNMKHYHGNFRLSKKNKKQKEKSVTV